MGGVSALLLPLLLPAVSLEAAALVNRSVTLGTSAPLATTTHTFRFDIATSDNLGSIEFEYCSNDPFVGTTCVAPDGLSLDNAVLAAEAGETGFTKHAKQHC